MSDDFLSDLNSAIEHGGELPSATSVATTAKDVLPITETPDDATETEVGKQLADYFNATDADSNYVAEPDKTLVNEPAKTEERKEKEATKTQDTKATETEESSQDQTTTTTPEKSTEQPSGNNQATQRFDRLLDVRFRADAQGNFLDKNGNILFGKGLPRDIVERLRDAGKHYREHSHELATNIHDLAGRFGELHAEYTALQQKQHAPIVDAIQQERYTPQEVAQLTAFIQGYKRDPIGTLKNILTNAAASGIKVSELGANISADPAALRQIVQETLAEHLGPISQREQQEQQQAARRQEAQDFFRDYPDAIDYAQIIGEAKEKYPDWSLPRIWSEIRQRIIARNAQQEFDGSDKALARPSPQTNQRTTPPQTEQVVTVAPKDYSKMSLDEIAASIKKDFG